MTLLFRRVCRCPATALERPARLSLFLLPSQQATHSGEGATNAAIAARPGLEVFTKALQLVQERDVDTNKQMIKVR